MQCWGFPLECWTKSVIRAFGSKLGKVLEIDQRNLNRVDCSTLRLFLELDVVEHLPPKVALNCGGKLFQILIAALVEPPVASSEHASQSRPISEHFPFPPANVQLSSRSRRLSRISRRPMTGAVHAGSTLSKRAGRRFDEGVSLSSS